MGADCDEVLLGRDELQCAWMKRNSGRRTAVDAGQDAAGGRQDDDAGRPAAIFARISRPRPGG
jgi:hypothetical protein